MSRTPSPESPLVEVGRYPRLADAREYALALAARDLAYVIEREEDSWLLRVEETVRESAERELATVVGGGAGRHTARRRRRCRSCAPCRYSSSLWAMGVMFFLQNSWDRAGPMRGRRPATAFLAMGNGGVP